MDAEEFKSVSNVDNGKALLENLLSLNSEAQIDEFLDRMISERKYSWATLGAPYIEEPAALIGVQPDPIKALVDRIDNMHDSIIEKYKPAESNQEPNSPREAVAKWLALSKDLSKEDDERLRNIAKMAQVRFVLTSKGGSPTVKFHDFGIGCINKNGQLDLRSTILSLLRGNKANKRYVTGVFGFGGSTTFWHCNRSLIVSRADSPEGIRDVVAWTIVRRRPPQGNEKRDQFEYLVCPNGECPAIDSNSIPTEVFPHGTYVAHSEYNLRTVLGTSKLLVTGSDMLYQRFRYLLFNTVLPFWLDAVDQDGNPIRGAEGKTISQARTMSGNLRVLKQAWIEDRIRSLQERKQVLLHDTYTNKDGLTIRYWIFNVRKPEVRESKVEDLEVDSVQQSKQPLPYISRYLDTWHRQRGDPVVLTINGRTHYTFPITVLREFGLQLLENYLLVQVDCDEMNWEARRNLFNKIASTRSDIKRELTEILMEELQEALGRDNQQLWAIVDFLVQKILAQTTEDTRVDKVLRRIILNYETRKTGKGERILGKGGLPTAGHVGTVTRYPAYIPISFELEDYPDPVEIEIGGKRILEILTDAPDDILEREEAQGEFEIHWLADSRFTATYSPPRNGIMRIYVTAPNDIVPGYTASLKAKLRVASQDGNILLETEPVNLTATTIDRPQYIPVDPPSKFAFAAHADPLKLKRGKITSVTLEFDGPDDFFERETNRGELEGFCSIEGVEPVHGRRGPYKGHITVHVKAPENMTEGATGSLVYRLKASGVVLEISKQCMIVPYKKKERRYGQSQLDEKVANIEVKWVMENDDNWIRLGWTREKHVAKAEPMPDGKLVIWVNWDYDRLKQFYKFRREKVNEEHAKLDLEHYKMQIAYYAWQRQKDGQTDSGDEVQAEYARVAETTMIGLLPLDQVTLF